MKHFNAFGGIALLMFAVVFFCACSDDDDSRVGNREQRITLKSLDIAGAKCLSISAQATRAEDGETSMLYKVDSDGNVSAVMLTYIVEEQEDGSTVTTETRHDLRVVPEYIASIEGVYTLLYNCQFIDEQGHYASVPKYDESYYFNILARNSDGKIFYIPGSLDYDYFWQFVDPSNCNGTSTAKDVHGNVYIASEKNGAVGKLTLAGDKMQMQQVTPTGIYAANHNDRLLPLGNGVLMVGPGNNYNCDRCFYYPTGGFEEFEGTEMNGDRRSGLAFYADNAGKLIGVKSIEEDRAQFDGKDMRTIALYKYNIGTTYGSLQQGDLLVSATQEYRYPANDDDDYWLVEGWGDSFVETDKFYFINNIVIDKQTLRFFLMTLKQANHYYQAFPSKSNLYKGRYWGIDQETYTAYWFNTNTLEYGEVQFDFAPSDFLITSQVSDIPNGVHYIYGLDRRDGNNVIYSINIETGRSTIIRTPNNRPVATLVPLN